MPASDYGKRYWCIELSDGTQIDLHADRIEVDEGALVALWQEDGRVTRSLLGIAPGAWRFYFGASVMDGSPVCAVRWPGELADPT